MKIITFEEHLTDPVLNPAVSKLLIEDAPYYGYVLGKGLPYYPDFNLYADIGELRIADMDKYGIDMQVFSAPIQNGYMPGKEAEPFVKSLNDRMADAINKHPDRFKGFAALPWSDPDLSAKELERAVKELGLSGAMLAGRPVRESLFLDDPMFDPILAKAEELNVPIYVHPGAPAPEVQNAYYARLGDELSARLSLFGWGWHNEAGIQVLRMVLAGVFDKHPNLQVISGHWGEFVPFYLSRLDQALPQKCTGLSTTITEAYAQHVYVTPSGIFDYPQLQFCISVLGAERILYSVDFPLIPHDGAREFIENAPISAADKEKIAFGNAEKLLNL